MIIWCRILSLVFAAMFGGLLSYCFSAGDSVKHSTAGFFIGSSMVVFLVASLWLAFLKEDE